MFDYLKSKPGWIAGGLFLIVLLVMRAKKDPVTGDGWLEYAGLNADTSVRLADSSARSMTATYDYLAESQRIAADFSIAKGQSELAAWTLTNTLAARIAESDAMLAGVKIGDATRVNMAQINSSRDIRLASLQADTLRAIKNADIRQTAVAGQWKSNDTEIREAHATARATESVWGSVTKAAITAASAYATGGTSLAFSGY